MDIRDAVKQITGKDPTDEHTQRLMAIAHTLGIPPNDQMMSILVMLDSYYSTYDKLPDKISASVKNVSTQLNSMAAQASQKAKDDAEADMRKAVAEMVPTVRDAVSSAASAAVKNVQVGQSMLSVFAASLMVGAVFLAGLLAGTDIFGSVEAHLMTWAQAFHIIKWGVFLGVAFPATLMLAGYFLIIDDYKGKAKNAFLGYGSLVVSMVMVGAYLLPMAALLGRTTH